MHEHFSTALIHALIHVQRPYTAIYYTFKLPTVKLTTIFVILLRNLSEFFFVLSEWVGSFCESLSVHGVLVVIISRIYAVSVFHTNWAFSFAFENRKILFTICHSHFSCFFSPLLLHLVLMQWFYYKTLKFRADKSTKKIHAVPACLSSLGYKNSSIRYIVGGVVVGSFDRIKREWICVMCLHLMYLHAFIHCNRLQQMRFPSPLRSICLLLYRR